MVGGFVQKQQVGIGQQQPCKLRLVALAAAEGVRAAVKLLLRKAQTKERGACPCPIGRAAEVVIAACQAVLAVDEPFTPCFAAVGIELAADKLKLVFDAHKLRKDLERVFVEGFVRIGDALGHAAYLRFGAEIDVPFVIALLPEEYAEQRGLAAAVHADKADMVARIDFKADARKQHPCHK